MNVIFPVSPNMSYSIVKRPNWSTLIKKSSSGKEQRASYYSTPIWEFEFPYGSIIGSDIDVLIGFVNLLRGAWDTFYFKDPLNRVIGQVIGTGTGSSATFQLSRIWNYWYTEYPSFPTHLGYGDAGEDYSGTGYGVPTWETPFLYFDGVLQTTGYTISQTGLVTYTAPNGVAVTIDWDFYYICRFKEDIQNFEYWVFNVWKIDSLVLTTVK
jgi:uncharacterized protein (TIGR02217 family)